MSFGTIKQPLPCIGKRNAISICMIVKNEEANIGRAIESFLPFADEIIVNDTGSTDKTIEIVQSFPKTVLMQSEWIGDFAYSRNLSLEKASCSWILWMDADDYVPPDQIEAFNKLKLAPLDRMISFTVCNTEEGGKPTGLRFMQARMFPNNKKIQFEGRIHESILKSVESLGLFPVNTNVEIWHMGYETLEIRQKKAKRNLELQLADPEHEKRIEGLVELGDSYSVLEDFEKSAEYYRRAMEFNCPAGLIDLKMHAMNKLARHLEKLNKTEESAEIYNRSLKQFPKNEEAYYGLALNLLSQGKKAESMVMFRKILTLRINVTIGGTNYHTIKEDSLKNLSLWEFEQGNFKLSRNYAEQMLKEYKDNQDAKILFERANAALLNKKDKRPLLSLCMIVKNEESNLKECLESVQGLADEIIITDTGSTDKTVEIAQNYGAKIEHFIWIKDFSAARNYSISKASSRWIIWLDADDRVPEKTVEEIRKKLSMEIPDKVFYFEICDNKGTRFSQIRVFPNNGKVQFEGRIHEQILPSIRKQKLPEIRLPLEIFHTGYEDPAILKEKQLRNLEIFKEQFPNEKGMNPLDMFHYGTCYEILDDYENALKWLKESLVEAKKQRYDELLVLLPNNIANILERQGDLQGALEFLDISLKENPQFESAMLKKAQILNIVGQKEEAIKWFGYSSSYIPKASALPSNSLQTHKKSLQFLAEYWNKSGQTLLAVNILKMLKNTLLGTMHNPLALAEIYIANDKGKEALDILEFLKKDLNNKPEFIFFYGQALALSGNIQEAIKIVSKAKEKFPQNSHIAELAKAMGI
ncbi:MAG: glycosyltransferase [Fibromonadaceae bacterium]|jgi:glycosyltransferase involved in cell wall biosynthesis|nr:glycosyltransferase [Fibromonadaceae bacterium]